jgi:hypothetical protein
MYFVCYDPVCSGDFYVCGTSASLKCLALASTRNQKQNKKLQSLRVTSGSLPGTRLVRHRRSFDEEFLRFHLSSCFALTRNRLSELRRQS